MALTLLTCNINNNDVSVPIDTQIELTFSSPVDEFSLLSGISLFSIGSQTWTGSLLSQKDSKTSDVKSKADQINMVEYSCSVSGSNIILKPLIKLDKKTKYFIQLAPGKDPSRFLTSFTYDLPAYSYANQTSNGIMEILSSYTGKINCVYTFNFNSYNQFDLLIDGIYDDTYTFEEYKQLTVNKNLNISFNGAFASGDSISLNCYTPVGLDSMVKIAFTTSDYVEATVKSTNIEDKLYAALLSEFKILSTIPSNMSVNNNRINPVIVKFNKDISQVNVQDILNGIRIYKLNFKNGSTKKLLFYPKVTGDTLKLYLTSVSNISEAASLPEYDLNQDALSSFSEYKMLPI